MKGTENFVEEFIHIVHYYAMKLYGARSYKKISELEKKALELVKDENN